MGANVQEEVGLRGAKASTELQPDIAFVVDCSANDIKGKQQLSGQLGEGTLIRIKRWYNDSLSTFQRLSTGVS